MTPSNKLKRRGFLAGFVALAASFGAPKVALALTKDQASGLVNSLVTEINGVINSGSSESRMIRDFERILGKYGDMNIVAQTVLGPPWRSASAAQRRAFTQALQGYIARKYGKRFREFIGGEIEVTGARKVRSFFEVKSIARLRGEAPFELIFLVSDRSGQNKFFNLIIEGINLRTTENTEINALLDRNRGDMDAMIAELQKRG